MKHHIAIYIDRDQPIILKEVKFNPSERFETTVVKSIADHFSLDINYLIIQINPISLVGRNSWKILTRPNRESDFGCDLWIVNNKEELDWIKANPKYLIL